MYDISPATESRPAQDKRRYIAAEAPPLVRCEASCRSMGTIFSIVAYGEDRSVVRHAVREAFEEIDRLNGLLICFRPESELSRINRHAWPAGVTTTAEVAEFLASAIRYSEETAGAFDISVGPLMKTWGFSRGKGRFPSPQELADILACVGFRNVEVDTIARRVRFLQQGTEIDPGAIGKGFALDSAQRILRRHGIHELCCRAEEAVSMPLEHLPGKRPGALCFSIRPIPTVGLECCCCETLLSRSPGAQRSSWRAMAAVIRTLWIREAACRGEES